MEKAKELLKKAWGWYKKQNLFVKWLIPIFAIAGVAVFFKPIAHVLTIVILVAIGVYSYKLLKAENEKDKK